MGLCRLSRYVSVVSINLVPNWYVRVVVISTHCCYTRHRNCKNSRHTVNSNSHMVSQLILGTSERTGTHLIGFTPACV